MINLPNLNWYAGVLKHEQYVLRIRDFPFYPILGTGLRPSISVL